MPIYEYQCDACQEKTEVLQKVSDPLLTECPACHEHRLRKLVSAAAFQLKGTGWYVTDFRDKNKGAARKNDAPAEGAKAKTGGGETKSDGTAKTEAAPAAAAKTAQD